jgi:hypothetical protein
MQQAVIAPLQRISQLWLTVPNSSGYLPVSAPLSGILNYGNYILECYPRSRTTGKVGHSQH